jgi:hypothetical protein
VPSTAETLARLAPGLEAQIQPRLAGFLGGIFRAYLPQTWVFRTEEDVASLVVDPNGCATVAPEALPSPDVTVELPHGALDRLLGGGAGPRPDPRSVRVTAHTSKGQTAFGYLRPRLGL